MLTHTIEHDGIKAVLNIPETVEEMNLNDFCDFGAWDAAYLAEATKEEPNEIELIALQIRLFKLLAPEIDWETYPIFGSEIQNVVETIRLCIEQAHTLYVPKLVENKAVFKVNGVTYYMNGASAELHPGIRKPLTALEAIEFQEVHDKYIELMEKALKQPNSNILIENVEFTYYSVIIALLYRRKNERIPLDETERRAWLEQRTKLFSKAPATAALDAKHFFFIKRNAYAKKIAQSLSQRLRKKTGKKQVKQALKKSKDSKPAAIGLS